MAAFAGAGRRPNVSTVSVEEQREGPVAISGGVSRSAAISMSPGPSRVPRGGS